jgi:hypothetical protein
VEKNMQNVKDEVSKSMKNNVKEMKKSGKDWVSYIQSHPLQSVLFGITAFFAIKGMFSDSKE